VHYNTISYPQYHAHAELATFAIEGGVTEHHALLHISAGQGDFARQAQLIQGAYEALRQELPYAHVVMRRYFLSDIANQAATLKALLKEHGCDQGACSIIGQPPLDGSKIALWVYLVEELDDLENLENLEGLDSLAHRPNLTTFTHNGYKHYWTTNWASVNGGSHSQTRDILESYERQLEEQQLNLADHCLRTWFYIRDVDTNYKGMVEARCSNFTKQRLTSDTHYIASTGIGGQPIVTQSRVQMDAYAADGLQPEQQQYLYAPTHLNPTYQYGVTFERGTAIQYGDRRHLLISGTASINNRGEVVYVGDITAQADRMLENIETLLAEGGATLDDIAHAIIYLRDVADFAEVRRIFDERLPQMPRVITLAPVCRPAWLIEMECIAISPKTEAKFAKF